MGISDHKIIEREEIKASGAHELGELLQGRAGLNVQISAGNAARAVIDMGGFGAAAGSNTLILLNGVKLNNSSDLAPPDLSSINLADVEKIEIIHGSAGTLYGNQAVGGVVNIVTHGLQRSGVQVQTGAGSFDAYELRLQATQHYQISGTAAQLNARKQENNLDREQSHTRRNHVSTVLNQLYSGGGITVEQQMQWENVQLPGALFAEEIAADRHQSAIAYQGDFSTQATRITRLNWHQDLDADWNLSVDSSYRDNDGRFKLSGRSWTGSRSTQERQIFQIAPRVSGPLHSLAGMDFNLTLGGELETVDYHLKTSYGSQAETQDNYAGYVQLATALSENWDASVGWRYAQVQNRIRNGTDSNVDDALSVGSASLAYEPAANWQIFSNWEQNYRFATVDEHTNVITGQAVGLKNQTGDSYTLGAAYQRADFNVRAQQYWLDLTNEIGFDSSSFFNINLPHTQRNGTLVELTWKPSQHWRYSADYTYTHSSQTSGAFAGHDLPLVPRHSGRLFADYVVNQTTELQLMSRLVGKRVLGGDFANNFDPMPGYGVVDATARYHTGPWQITAKLENVFDHQYNADGAIGYDAEFNTRAAYFPAAGRSIWLTFSYEN